MRYQGDVVTVILLPVLPTHPEHRDLVSLARCRRGIGSKQRTQGYRNNIPVAYSEIGSLSQIHVYWIDPTVTLPLSRVPHDREVAKILHNYEQIG